MGSKREHGSGDVEADLADEYAYGDGSGGPEADDLEVVLDLSMNYKEALRVIEAALGELKTNPALSVREKGLLKTALGSLDVVGRVSETADKLEYMLGGVMDQLNTLSDSRREETLKQMLADVSRVWDGFSIDDSGSVEKQLCDVLRKLEGGVSTALGEVISPKIDDVDLSNLARAVEGLSQALVSGRLFEEASTPLAKRLEEISSHTNKHTYALDALALAHETNTTLRTRLEALQAQVSPTSVYIPRGPGVSRVAFVDVYGGKVFAQGHSPWVRCDDMIKRALMSGAAVFRGTGQSVGWVVPVPGTDSYVALPQTACEAREVVAHGVAFLHSVAAIELFLDDGEFARACAVAYQHAMAGLMVILRVTTGPFGAAVGPRGVREPKETPAATPVHVALEDTAAVHGYVAAVSAGGRA